MKHFTSALALVLCAAGPASAAPLEIIDAPAAGRAQPGLFLRAADLVPLPATRIVAAPTRMSELPEPEVFLMMLVGLCLIGYRASRISDEKFE